MKFPLRIIIWETIGKIEKARFQKNFPEIFYLWGKIWVFCILLYGNSLKDNYIGNG